MNTLLLRWNKLIETTQEGENIPNNLKDLEAKLQNLSHDTQALEILKDFANKIGKTKDRQRLFNTYGALVCKPIEYQEVLNKGIITLEEDHFNFLQGDIVSTEAAYFLGERITSTKFAIASSTCDLVPDRREYAVLLRLQPITPNYPNAKQIIGEMLTFKSKTRMYLPPLPGDSKEVIANAVLFDGIVQISLNNLLMSTRHSSLSLVGWRIFGSLIRNIIVRAGENEAKIRSIV